MEVITGLLEWSYHREDEFGIKMGAYAHFAINKKYGNLQNKEFMKSFRESELLKYFLDLEGDRSKYYKNIGNCNMNIIIAFLYGQMLLIPFL